MGIKLILTVVVFMNWHKGLVLSSDNERLGTGSNFTLVLGWNGTISRYLQAKQNRGFKRKNKVKHSKMRLAFVTQSHATRAFEGFLLGSVPIERLYSTEARVHNVIYQYFLAGSCIPLELFTRSIWEYLELVGFCAVMVSLPGCEISIKFRT